MNEDHIFGRSMRTLPRNEQAEQALLGAMLANNRAYERVADFLRPVHFADPVHGQIYRVMTTIIDAGGLADAVTVKKHFDNNDGLSEVGGTKYLGELLGAMVGILNAETYGRAIFEAYQRREIIASLSEALEAAYDGARPLAEVLGAVAGVDAVTTEVPGDMGGDRIGEAVDKALAAAERAAKGDGPTGVSTGFFALDDVIGGLGPRTLNVLAGRPGMGKSALGFQIAINAARKGVGVLVLSLEMSTEELGRRALSVASGVPVTQLKRGFHTKKIDALLAARKELSTLPLTIDDASGMTAASIRAKARRARRKGPLGLVMIDHLHIVRPEDSDVKQGATWAVGRISGLMKQMAKELNCPVLLLAQLSRAVESRDEKRPVLSDLRQSGDIEQDADTVMFVYRPEYYLPKSAPDIKPTDGAERAAAKRAAHELEKERLAGVAEVVVAKNRDGREDVVHLRFDGPSISFSEVTDAAHW